MAAITAKDYTFIEKANCISPKVRVAPRRPELNKLLHRLMIVLYLRVTLIAQENPKAENAPKAIALPKVTEDTNPGFLQPMMSRHLLRTETYDRNIPQENDMERTILRYDLFETNYFIVQMQGFLTVAQFYYDLAAALLGGCSGFSRKSRKNRMKGTVTMIASSLMNLRMSSLVDVGCRNSPAMAAPMPLERKLMRTVAEMILGAASWGNHLMAKMEGELRMNRLPRAQKSEPAVTRSGLSTCMRLRSQTPMMTSTPPMEQPTLTPHLSRVMLMGVATRGCAMALRRMFMATTRGEQWNYFSTRVLMLAKTEAGSPFTSAAPTNTSRFTQRQGASRQPWACSVGFSAMPFMTLQWPGTKVRHGDGWLGYAPIQSIQYRISVQSSQIKIQFNQPGALGASLSATGLLGSGRAQAL